MIKFLRRLKERIVLFILLGLLLGFVSAYNYNLGHPPVYTAEAEISFTQTGKIILGKEGLDKDPHKIFSYKELDFLKNNPTNKPRITIPSTTLDNMTIFVEGDTPDVFNSANRIASLFKEIVEEKASSLLSSQHVEAIDRLNKDKQEYVLELEKLRPELDKMELRLEELAKKKNSTTTMSDSIQAKIAELELKKSELLRLFTESHPEVVNINTELGILNERLKQLPEVKGITTLIRNINEKRAEHTGLETKIAALDTELRAITKPQVEAAEIVSFAERPSAPINLSKSQVFTRGILGGIILAIVLSVVFTSTHNVIYSEAEITGISGLPLLGSVPYLKPKARQEDAGLIKRPSSKSPLLLSYEDSSEFAESYRSLVVYIIMRVFGGNIDKKIILFSSPSTSEGKSTLSANFAITLARLGKRVILVDANLNKPVISKLFGIKSGAQGLTDVLNKSSTLEDSLRGVTDMLLGNISLDTITSKYGLDRLKILTAGSKTPAASGLLASESASALFKRLSEQPDCVIVDAPGILKSADSAVLSPRSDAVFLVCRLKVSSHSDIIKANNKLTAANITNKGIILVCT